MIFFKYSLIALLFSASAFCVSQPEKIFSSSLNQTRYQNLIVELRCPKCQNQNLADSNSDISIDLRGQIYHMIESKKSDQEIIDYMVARYGDFVLYRPRHSAATFLLWYGPYILLGIGLLAFVCIVYLNQIRKGTRHD